MNSRFKSTGGKEIEEKCPVRIYVIEITYILTGQDIYSYGAGHILAFY